MGAGRGLTNGLNFSNKACSESQKCCTLSHCMKRKPSRIGRPPLPGGELRKHRVTVHLTDSELAKLREVATERDADLGAAARVMLVAGLKRRRK